MKRLHASGAILTLTASMIAVSSFSSPASAAQPLPGKSVALQEKLKDAVRESEPKLGTLEPWQKKIFEDEVVPSYQVFIKDYRSVGREISADVDVDSIRNYLAYYAPSVSKPKENAALVVLRAG